MRIFIIFLFVALTHAERVGYNFRQSGSPRHRFNSVPTTATPSIHTNQIRSELNNRRNGYTANSIQTGNLAGPVETTAYNKIFYSYSAPEDEAKDIEAAHHLAAATPENLRVVFIKAPENNAFTQAALQLVRKNTESKTAIYVLTKQTDVADLVNQLQAIQPSQESRPEVHFVKYRTPEDAVRAQQIIQNEFDALGGTSRVTNEGVAPVLDFSSKNGQPNNINIGTMNSVAMMLNSFLPSKSRQ